MTPDWIQPGPEFAYCLFGELIALAWPDGHWKVVHCKPPMPTVAGGISYTPNIHFAKQRATNAVAELQQPKTR